MLNKIIKYSLIAICFLSICYAISFTAIKIADKVADFQSGYNWSEKQ